MSEQTIKEVWAKFTADLSDYRKQVQNAGKISQDLQDRISAIGDAMTAAQNVTGAEMQRISRSLSSAGKQAATLGKQAQSLAADESQLTRAIAEQEGSLNRMEAEYNSLQTEPQRLSGIFDTVKEAVSGLNLSGTLSEELEKAKESLASYDNEIAQLRAKLTESSGMGYTAIQLDDGSIVSLEQAKQKLQEMTTAADQAAARVEELAAAEHKVGQANLGYASTAGLKQLQTEIGNNKSRMEQLSLQAGQTASRLLTYQERLDQTKSKQQQTAAATQTLTNEVSEMENAAASATAPASLSERLASLASRAREAAEGGLSKLGSALLTIGKNAGSSVLSGLKSLASRITGIASPSKKMAEVGGYLVEGLEQGVEDEDPASYFEDVWADISGVFDGVDSWFSDTFSSAFTSAEDAWSSSKTTFTTVKDNVVSGFSTLKDNVSTKFSTAMTGAESAWSGAKTAFTTVSGNVVDGFSALSANLKQSFGTAFSSAKNAWGNAKSVFTTVSSNVVSGFKSLSSDIKSKFKTAISTVKGLDWKGTGTNVVSGILNGMYNWGSKLKSWASSPRKSSFRSNILKKPLSLALRPASSAVKRHFRCAPYPFRGANDVVISTVFL
ncbi:MAG: hypothetical protein LUF28_11570, partial [Clostridiales bacterium]|nr:hypothetical protein [Clostridiales bacterium]